MYEFNSWRKTFIIPSRAERRGIQVFQSDLERGIEREEGNRKKGKKKVIEEERRRKRIKKNVVTFHKLNFDQKKRIKQQKVSKEIVSYSVNQLENVSNHDTSR